MTEPELLEAMHTQAAPVAPDGDDYTYARLPALVRREELDATRGERDSLRVECVLLLAERNAAQAVLRVTTSNARADLTTCAAMLQQAAHLLHGCGLLETARQMNEQAARVTARWAVQP